MSTEVDAKAAAPHGGAPFVILPSKWKDADSTEISFMESTSPTSIPPPPSLTIPTNALPLNDPIDSTLFEALGNENRKNVLIVENTILDFVRSSDRQTEIPPTSNSFKRLLFHRISDRFGVEHSLGEGFDAAERVLILRKTANTKVPKPLLIDVKVSPVPPLVEAIALVAPDRGVAEVTATASTSTSTSTSASASASVVAPVPGSAAPPMRVMRRTQPSSSATSGRGSGSEKQSTAPRQLLAVDKEKKYAMAKARIFGETASDGSEPTADIGGLSLSEPASPSSSMAGPGKSSSTSGKAATASGSLSALKMPIPVVGGSPLGGPLPRGASASPSSNSSPRQTPPPVSTPPIREASAASEGSHESRGVASPSPGIDASNSSKRTSVDPAQWKGDRYTPRDVANEKSDPDFSRSRLVNRPPAPPQVPMPPNQQYNAYPTHAPYGGPYAPQGTMVYQVYPNPSMYGAQPQMGMQQWTAMPPQMPPQMPPTGYYTPYAPQYGGGQRVNGSFQPSGPPQYRSGPGREDDFPPLGR